MEKLNEIRKEITSGRRGWVRWALIAAGALAAALLAGSLETGRAQSGGTGFKFSGALVRLVTPNGDKKNDMAIVCYENPRDSEVIGKIYDLRGGLVSHMVRVEDAGNNDPTVNSCEGKFPPTLFPARAEAMTWNGTTNGLRASAGVYIYQLQSEDVVVTGTLLVVR